MKGNSYVPFMLRRGDGSTLSLDFTAMGGTLDSRFTFTRSSTATYVNSQGYVQFSNANLMTYSNPRQTGSAWASTGTVTWGSSTITDPTGGASAQSIVFGTVGSAIFNTTGTTVTSGITHTFSVWMRSATGTTTVRIGDANVAPISTVTLTTTWQRFSCQYTTSGTNDGGAIYSQTGTPSAEFYVWGAQVQPGSVVGELLETTGTIRRDVPRFDYDPTTLTARGLLIEGSAINLLLYSQFAYTGSNPPTGWTSPFTGGPGSSATSTYGTLDGSNAWTQTASSNRPMLSSTAIALTSGNTYTVSMYLEAVSGGLAYQDVLLLNPSTATVGSPTYRRNGVTVNASDTAQIGRIEATLSCTGSGNSNLRCGPGSNASCTGSATFSRPQVEVGTAASSFIPTSGSTVQRTADTCIAASTGFSSWFTGGTSGTFYADWYGGVRGITSTVRTVLSTSDVTARHLHLHQTAPAGNLKVADFTAANVVTTLNSITSGARTKGAFSFSGGTVNLTLNGGTVATSSSLAFSTAPTWLVLGGTSTDGSTITDATVLLNGSIRAIKYWPSVLTTATLQSLTA